MSLIPFPRSRAAAPLPPSRESNPAERWFGFVVAHRFAILGLTLLLIAGAAMLARGLHKDASANAYLEPGNPALLYREHVVENFGLKEPIIVAVRQSDADGILDRDSLALVRRIVERLESVPNIDADRITSLVSQSAITGGAEGLEVGPLLPAGEIDAARIASLRATLNDTPIYDGTLVSKDRTATLIAAEQLDESAAAETYQAVLDVTDSLGRAPGTEIFVAGAGAITGYFSSYIDRDAGRMVPIAAIAISLVLFAAYFTIRAAALPMLVAVATIFITLGAMAASGVAFFAITNGMIVALIGIGVADSIHVFNEYYASMREQPQESNARLTIDAMTTVWRPIALVAITTVAGFLALWVGSTMPPIRYFGLFGALGVTVAWILTMTFLPAFISLLPKRQSRLYRHRDVQRPDRVGRLLLGLGIVVTRWPRTTLLIAALVSMLAAYGATQVTVDHARIENFNETDRIHVADREINRTMAGTNQLDIVVEGRDSDDVLTPQALRHIDRLQSYLESLPAVGGSISIVDYLKQLNRSVHGGERASFRVPDDQALIAQLMLTYRASAPPTEFQALIDSAGRSALVRVYLRADRWSEQSEIVRAAQKFIDGEFADSPVKATLTGRVMIDYEWMSSVTSGHAMSVLASALGVLLMCVLIFRSWRDGLVCQVPLVIGVLFVYAAMGLADIWLGVATSMFASVAVGLGVDFAIHIVERTRSEGILDAYRTTGRATLFNATAVGLGFGVLMLSSVPPIRMFGVLVATAIVGAFIAALTVLPAVLELMKRSRLRADEDADESGLQRAAPLLALIVLSLTPIGRPVQAETSSETDAARIMDAVANRPEGDSADRTVHISLIDRGGTVREQVARAVRKNVADGRRMAVFYQSPANIRGTSFLVFDYTDLQRENDQWLYLPALRKVRRIPASDRGDYFLGTDLTFDEIRNDNRVTLSDWRFRRSGEHEVDGMRCTLVEGTAASDAIARELGYGRARWCVDTQVQMARRVEYWDRAGNLLKTVTNHDVVQVDGIWTAGRVEVTNHKTGHGTHLEFRDSRFDAALGDALFTQQQMERGL